MAKLLLDGTGLTVEALAAAARGTGGVTLAESGLAKMRETRALIDHAIENRIPVYGVTTGLGARSTEALDAETLAGFSLQTVRGRAHAVGEPMPRDTVRALMLARLNTLLTGYSGARPEVAEYLAAVLDANLVPVAGGLGSIGGGDLVLNATVALALIGEGKMTNADGQKGPSADMLRAAGIEPLQLAPRDGLALANHTGFSAGEGALALDGALTGFAAAQAAACLTMEGFRANLSPLDPRAGGTNQLIKDGAPLIENAADALAALAQQSTDDWFREPSGRDGYGEPPAVPPEISDPERAEILSLLGPTPVEVDFLIRQSGLPARAVAAILLEIDLSGKLRREPGQKVALIPPEET